LPDELALVPGIAEGGLNDWCQHLELLLLERSSKRKINLIEGIPTYRSADLDVAI
jgi:hypothetical protein